MNAPLLDRGLYTVGDAARLLRTSPQKVRGWISGYPNTTAEPILQNDIGWLDGSLAFSFANLMEIRFIDFFSRLGVKVGAIRAMAKEAQEVLKHPHPFATKTVFQTDGKVIFAQVEKLTHDKALYDLKKKNWAMLEVLQQSLQKGVQYDPSGDIASWHPRAEYPDIVVNPRISFGHPVLENSGVPTRALYESFQAEGESFESVAHWFEIPVDAVRNAVGFEAALTAAN